MFHLVSDIPYNPTAPRRVYDNPPFMVEVPRWPRLARRAASIQGRATHRGRQARATSPAPVCGSASHG
jgi:hypothetical protein